MKEIRLRPVEIAILVAIAAICIAAPFYGSRLALYNLTIIALYSTVVISLNLLLGLAGQASFAQTTFMAIGGYGIAILTTRFGLNPWLAIAISFVLAIGLALLIGRPLLRLRGHYLSMGTVALALGTASFANASSFTNGGWGISGIPPLDGRRLLVPQPDRVSDPRLDPVRPQPPDLPPPRQLPYRPGLARAVDAAGHLGDPRHRRAALQAARPRHRGGDGLARRLALRRATPASSGRTSTISRSSST